MKCECCGHEIREYRHSLNAGLMKALEALCLIGGQAKLSELKLTFNQANNFQKLKHWGLTIKTPEGIWILTEKGKNFYDRKISIPYWVTTKKNKTIGESKEQAYFNLDIIPLRYKKRYEYFVGL